MTKKTRLTKALRETLEAFALKNIQTPEETEADEAAYAAAHAAAMQDYERRLPKADLAILKKYGATVRTKELFGAAGCGASAGIKLRGDAVQAPCWKQCHKTIKWSAQTLAALQALGRAEAALERAREDKMTFYRQLILSAKTLEAVIEIWPAAEACRPEKAQLPAAISQEARDFIARDNAGAGASEGKGA